MIVVAVIITVFFAAFAVLAAWVNTGDKKK